MSTSKAFNELTEILNELSTVLKESEKDLEVVFPEDEDIHLLRDAVIKDFLEFIIPLKDKIALARDLLSEDLTEDEDYYEEDDLDEEDEEDEEDEGLAVYTEISELKFGQKVRCVVTIDGVVVDVESNSFTGNKVEIAVFGGDIINLQEDYYSEKTFEILPDEWDFED